VVNSNVEYGGTTATMNADWNNLERHQVVVVIGRHDR